MPEGIGATGSTGPRGGSHVSFVEVGALAHALVETSRTEQRSFFMRSSVRPAHESLVERW